MSAIADDLVPARDHEVSTYYHEKAIKKINTETPIDETSEVKKGDEEQFNVIEIADQFA